MCDRLSVVVGVEGVDIWSEVDEIKKGMTRNESHHISDIIITRIDSCGWSEFSAHPAHGAGSFQHFQTTSNPSDSVVHVHWQLL